MEKVILLACAYKCNLVQQCPSQFCFCESISVATIIFYFFPRIWPLLEQELVPECQDHQCHHLQLKDFESARCLCPAYPLRPSQQRTESHRTIILWRSNANSTCNTKPNVYECCQQQRKSAKHYNFSSQHSMQTFFFAFTYQFGLVL